MSFSTAHDSSSLPTVTPTMNPLHESGSTLPPDVTLPTPQRDWRSMTRTIAHYERIEQIGEGTYGQVYRARCKDTNQIVALKKIRVHHGDYWGLPPTVLREIKILKRLRHPNLVQMVEVVSSKGVEHLDDDDQVEEKHRVSKNDKVGDAREGYKGNLFLVLEYVSHDLMGLMDVAYRFTEVQVKCIFKQLLDALQYMHDNKYVHRDIKSSNILIDHHFRLKLADFGLARSIEPPIIDRIHDRGNSQEFTNKVITLWYRPPELLLGATRYGTAVDIWSAGCILAELILGKPLFCGKTDMEQLQLIFEMLGTPTQETWNGFQDLKLLRTGEVTVGNNRKAKLRDKYHHKMSPAALNLIEKLLELDPTKRLTADRALNSRYFLSEPKVPDRPEDLGTIQLEGGHFHEFQTKKKRKEAKAIAEQTKQNALEMGKSEKEAQDEFDAVYRGIMEKVAKEGVGIGANVGTTSTVSAKLENSDSAATKEKVSSESNERSRKDKPERKRSSRDKDKGDKERERESRRDKKSRDERREERKKEGKDRDRSKDKTHRRRSDSEGNKDDEERRRKRRRDERETSLDRKKMEEDSIHEKPNHSSVNVADPPKSRKGDDVETEEQRPSRSNNLPHDDGATKDITPRRRRSRSPDEQERRRTSRDERRRSRDRDRDRDRDRNVDRSRESRRRSEGHERERDREWSRGRRERDIDDWGPEGGMQHPIRDGDHGRPRRDRDGTDRPFPRGDVDFRDDFGPKRGPYGPQRGLAGPDFRGPPPPRRDDVGPYGPATSDFRGPPGPVGPSYYDNYDFRHRERDASPRRDRGHRR